MFDVACERGVGNVSVAEIVQRSGVSRRTFYEQFDDREGCFLAAFDEALRYVSERVLSAYRAQNGWRERIRAGLIALLAFLDDEPLIGRLLIAESLAAGPNATERRSRVLAQLIAAVDAGRGEMKARSLAPSPLIGEGVVGGTLSIVYTRLLEADHAPLVELANPLMSMIVAPYLGSAIARRELESPAPAPGGPSEHTALLSDPFKDAGMRLTYRTVRVLMAIVDSPGASNRTVGEGAGILDQGQISKLLARLLRIGLILNTGLGPGQGAPNAWSLTPEGRQVALSIRAHTENTSERPGM